MCVCVCVRARVCVGGSGGVTPHTWGGRVEWGCWIPAQERDPSPSPPAAGGLCSSNRWTEPKGRGRADGVRDGSAAAGPPGALTKAGAGGAGRLISASRPGGRAGARGRRAGAQRPRAARGGGAGGAKINCPIKLSARGGGGAAAPGDAGRRIMKCAKS